MKRSEVTLAKLMHAGWRGPLNKMVAAVHKKGSRLTIQTVNSANFEVRNAFLDGKFAASIYRPLA